MAKICSDGLQDVYISKFMQAPPTDQQLHSNQLNSEAFRRALRVHSAHLGPVRINADDQKKWKIVVYSLVFVAVLILLSLISALVLPDALVPVDEKRWISGTSVQYCSTHLYLENSTVHCYGNNVNYSTTGAYVTNLQALNQFLVLYLRVDRDYYRDKDLNLNEEVQFALYNAVRESGSSEIKTTSVIEKRSIALNGRLKEVFKDGKLFILYMSKLSKDDDFYWQITFQNNSQLSPSTTQLDSQLVNPNFSLFTILYRVALFLVSLGVFLKFNQLIFKMPKDKVSIQQRFIQVLSAVTLTFNDQFYFITIIVPNPFSSFLSSFFLWNFAAYLFVIWSLFLNRIRKEQPEQSTLLFTLPRIGIILIFYALVLSYTIAYAVLQTSDHPVFRYQDITSRAVIGLSVTAFVIFGLACTYIIYLIVRAIKDRPNRLYRHNVFLVLTVIFFISTMVFFFVGGYNVYDYSASKIFFTLAFMNLYSFYLQYLYAPTAKQMRIFAREAKQTDPLMSEDLIEIPDSGQVQIVLVQSSENNNSDEVRSNENIIEESRDQGSMSARQRRKRRKLRQSKQQQKQKQQPFQDRGTTNSQIIRQEVEKDDRDEFS